MGARPLTFSRQAVHLHCAYGLTLAADRLIPGLSLLPGKAPADVAIKLGRLPPSLIPAEVARGEPRYSSPYRTAEGTPVMKLWKGGNGYYLLRYSDGLDFAVDDAGSEIWGAWQDELSLEVAALFLRGPVMSFVLGLRGLLCLHASAVVIDGRAVGFAGPPGAGKSTTAAVFAGAGFALLSDDLLAIATRGEALLVQPAYPRICVWPDSAAALGRTPEELPRLAPGDEKRYIELEADKGGFHSQPAPLAAIYILSPRPPGSCEPGLEEYAGAEELLSLLANNYGTGLLDRERRAKEFTLLGRLAHQVRIRRARIPRDPARLDQVRELILGDLRGASLKE